MPKNITKILSKLPKSRKQKVQQRAAELISLEMTVQELRRSKEFTQEQVAKILGVGQDSVSRLEKRPDIKISTLQGYIDALGGKLTIIAEFPGQESIKIVGVVQD